MKDLDAFLKDSKYHFQHIVRLFKDFLQILVSVCLCLQYAFFQQRFLICKNLVERTFGNSQCCRNVIHRNTLDTFQSKSFCCRRYNPLS